MRRYSVVVLALLLLTGCSSNSGIATNKVEENLIAGIEDADIKNEAPEVNVEINGDMPEMGIADGGGWADDGEMGIAGGEDWAVDGDWAGEAVAGELAGGVLPGQEISLPEESEPEDPNPSAGLLTGGEWNDNNHWADWVDLYNSHPEWADYKRNWAFVDAQRVEVTVKAGE